MGTWPLKRRAKKGAAATKATITNRPCRPVVTTILRSHSKLSHAPKHDEFLAEKVGANGKPWCRSSTKRPFCRQSEEKQPQPPNAMESSGLTLATVLVATSGLFVLATLFFGTKGGYYDSDDYDGNGTAH